MEFTDILSAPLERSMYASSALLIPPPAVKGMSMAAAILSTRDESVFLFSTVAVSVTGGVLHNVGQILMACLLLETNVIVYYLPFLILSGVIAGVVIGVVAAIMVNRVQVEY